MPLVGHVRCPNAAAAVVAKLGGGGVPTPPHLQPCRQAGGSPPPQWQQLQRSVVEIFGSDVGVVDVLCELMKNGTKMGDNDDVQLQVIRALQGKQAAAFKVCAINIHQCATRLPSRAASYSAALYL